MNNVIDLHGMEEIDATGAIMTALISFDFSDMDEIEIITGKGNVLTRTLEDILDEEGYSYYHANGNYGSYMVKKK